MALCLALCKQYQCHLCTSPSRRWGLSPFNERTLASLPLASLPQYLELLGGQRALNWHLLTDYVLYKPQKMQKYVSSDFSRT